jgi:hypothetical protein
VDSVELTDDDYDTKVRAYRITGGVLAGVDFICFCIIVFLRDRINLAIAVVQDSGRVLQDMKALACFPLWPIVLGCGYLAFWLYVMLTLYSVGTMENESTPYTVTHDFLTGLPNSNPTLMVVRKWTTQTRCISFVLLPYYPSSWITHVVVLCLLHRLCDRSFLWFIMDCPIYNLFIIHGNGRSCSQLVFHSKRCIR